MAILSHHTDVATVDIAVADVLSAAIAVQGLASRPMRAVGEDRLLMNVSARDDFVKDYRELARALLCHDVLRRGKEEFRVLDTCCGTGRWAQAFSELVLQPLGITAACDFIDLCAQSMAVLCKRLPNMQNVRSGSLFTGDVCQLSQLGVPALAYDLIVNMHGLYGVPKAKLATALQGMYDALAPGGTMLIALGANESAYQQFPQSLALKYCDPDDVLEAFGLLGISATASHLSYHEEYAKTDEASLHRFLMDECGGNTFTVDQVSEANSFGCSDKPPAALAAFASKYFDLSSGMYRFSQKVTVVEVTRAWSDGPL